MKQNVEEASTKCLVVTTPHRSKPPIDSRCLTKSITKPAIHRKRLVINNTKIGLPNKRVNQENMPLIIAATKTLADPILAKSVIKTRSNTYNILTAKSGKLH